MDQGPAGRSLRDVMPPRPRWADLQDSSQENNDSQPAPPLSQGSYNEPLENSQEDHSRASLPESLECAILLQSSPKAGTAAEPGNGCTAASMAFVQPMGDRSWLPTVVGPAGSGIPGLPAVAEEPGAPAAAPLAPLSERLRAWRSLGQCGGSGSQREVAGGRQADPPTSSPPTTPARRRRRNELEPQSTIQTPLGKRSRGLLPPPAPDASKEDWARRLQKRRTAIAAIKRMPEYSACAEARLGGALAEGEVPLTPEPDDCTVSKRQWEAAVMQWRALLKRLAPPDCVDLDS
eukprot:CAMPEP_0175634730 /NCGR_PEP_ID=MMETSP0097-20121207/1328_1 /TAXON_ID=311494 /ORGANISM="Alexandrium monilatum, Strain CCMP3105" /LENGTH=290 /DNA_ID=CAMNT_0016940349 /DNA_START=16 /DNA_END=885 /DNA_ORIENTATION=+